MLTGCKNDLLIVMQLSPVASVYVSLNLQRAFSVQLDQYWIASFRHDLSLSQK